jgi:catechol 2,3-dioxygenase-like lactoylglutathione lyase family enzyme
VALIGVAAWAPPGAPTTAAQDAPGWLEPFLARRTLDVSLAACDLEASRRFYGEGLGLTLKGEPVTRDGVTRVAYVFAGSTVEIRDVADPPPGRTCGATASGLADLLRRILGQDETPMEWFARMDRNGDGRLSRDEVNSPRFDELDTDHDGYVTLAEFKAYLTREAYRELDKNGDGKISWEEFNALYFDHERYYRERRRMAQPLDRHPLPDPFPVQPDPLGIAFSQDLLPGARDPLGRTLNATETTALVAHGGSLFASFGATRRSAAEDPAFQGYGVFRKDSAEGPWQVDLDLGPAPFRVSTMTSAELTTDWRGRRLAAPARILVASPWLTRKELLVRDDAAGAWVAAPVPVGPELRPGESFAARAFGRHVDQVTGVHALFAGANLHVAAAVGEFPAAVYRAAYDPAAPGGLRWAAEVELTGVGRIMGFAECNGELYLAAGILDDTPLSGGVFRRLDGPAPRWEQVYRWPEYDLASWDDEVRIMRGLSAVPDPAGGGHEVLLGFRHYPEPVIERIDPRRGHAATVELNLAEFFGRALHGGGKYGGPIRAAYNGFVPMTDPATGQMVHLTGVQIYHPAFPTAPHNGSFYLVRHRDGTYDWGQVLDPDHPVTPDRALDATRTILASPFLEDRGRVLYFGGYDGAFVDNRTAWIYRAVLPRAPGATLYLPRLMVAGATHPSPLVPTTGGACMCDTETMRLIGRGSHLRARLGLWKDLRCRVDKSNRTAPGANARATPRRLSLRDVTPIRRELSFTWSLRITTADECRQLHS